MKVCDYCGLENDKDALVCRECGSKEFWTADTETVAAKSLPPPLPRPDKPDWEFHEPAPEELKQDLVTLLTCRTLGEADVAVSELASAGIEAFIPDESVSQTSAWNVGYVRVQITPKDYDLAKAFLATPPEPGGAGAADEGSKRPQT
jgi:hypothetical protein